MDQNELCHYGVVGMRWGHHKNGYYEGKSSSQVSKIGKSKTILGKNLHNYMAKQNDYKSNVRKAGYSKTRLGRSINEAKSFNNKTASEANARLHNSKNIIDYGSKYIDALAHRKVKTWSGRTTTTGKQFVDSLLTVGILGTVKDIQYYRNNK